MSKLLYIQASPRIERSHSRAVADALIEAYRQANPDDQIQTLDIFEADLPAFVPVEEADAFVSSSVESEREGSAMLGLEGHRGIAESR